MSADTTPTAPRSVSPPPAEPDRSGPLRVTAEPRLRAFWYPVATVDAVTDRPVARTLLGVELVLWRAGGTVHAARDRCPHRDARLSLGWLDGCSLVCPYHGWEYDPAGRATRVPQLPPGAALAPRAALDVVRATVRYGWVWVCLDDEPVLPIPDIPELAGLPDDGEAGAENGWRVVSEPESVWRCPAATLLDNNLDPGHIAFVHRGSFGTPDTPEVPVADVARSATGLTSGYEIGVRSRPGEVGGTVRRTTVAVHGPFLGVFRIDYPDGLRHVMVKACTPVDDATTRQLQLVARNDTEADRPAADIVAFDAGVWEEDRRVLEHLVDGFRLDLVANVHLRTDRTSIEYRRLLADIVAPA